MTLAPTLERYLADRGVPYDVQMHPPTPSASRAAQAGHISGNAVAKAVVLKDGDGHLLAVLPASHEIDFDDLERLLGRRVELAPEREVAALFPDCEEGAVPALGAAYGLKILMDERIAEPPEVYVEGGDHTSLIRISGEQFQVLMGDAQRSRFSHLHVG